MKPEVSHVHVVFKTHLDLGFTDYAGNVIQRYLDDYIPGALRLARETRNRPDRFVWTMGSWLVHQYLEKASPVARRKMEDAIRAGDFHWHALPFTTHTELMDAELFRQGLRYSERLDARFGRKTRAAKMTDVPGHTRAMVPLLAASGVRLLHLGLNPASPVPNVPPVFLWRSEGAEVVVIYEKVYGATTVFPGGVALSVNLTGDNCGPQNPEEISKAYESLQKRFPGAKMIAGSFDAIADWLWRRRGSLPVITSEIGDTWIHGVGTDPSKVARFRTLCRLRSQWIDSGKLEAGGKEDALFAENLLLTAEHTWGMDIKTHLSDRQIFSPTGLQRALKKPNFKAVSASWNEQRAYVDAAIKSLPSRLGAEAQKELAHLQISPRERKGKALSLTQPFRLGGWTVALNTDGSIRQLRRDKDRRTFADARHQLGSFSYQLFSPDDYRRFYRQYNVYDVWWAQEDFTKPGLPPVRAAGWYKPRMVGLEACSEDEVRITLRFPAPALRYGAPASSTIYLRAHEAGLDFRLEWQKKRANRIPEALWMTFHPKLPADAAWSLEKMGIPIDPLDVVDRGGKHLHAVSGPVSAKEFSVFSLDAPLVAPGQPSLLDFNDRQPDLRAAGVSFNLYNNAWGTNFPMWYSDDAVFRFQLRWKPVK